MSRKDFNKNNTISTTEYILDLLILCQTYNVKQWITQYMQFQQVAPRH